jgi:hypothetical protein
MRELQPVLYVRVRLAEGQSLVDVFRKAQVLGYELVPFEGWTDEDLGASGNHGPMWERARENARAIQLIQEACEIIFDDGTFDRPHIITVETDDDAVISGAARTLGRRGGAVKSAAKTLAVRGNARKPRPRRYTHAARYHGGVAYLLSDFDLQADYESPRTHRASFEGRWVRVIVDHEATGTGTPGTGDTVCRSIPRGWKSGDR